MAAWESNFVLATRARTQGGRFVHADSAAPQLNF